MIDNFSLGITHALMLIVAYRLLFRPDLDAEPPPQADPEAKSWLNRDA